ncbi:homo-isocitrate dehydrogenase [Aspergillus cavernicola]|uniref:Homo-isocitrate dehydrogenase n=1 Tax=Aspergillus cavernicola TaxID=176166 RepID=A0ABR4HXZ9_9EURO
MTIQTLRVGLAIGHGTGLELTAIFEKVIQELAKQQSVAIEFIRSDRTYHSYHTLTISGSDKDLIKHIADETTEDAQHYMKFCATVVALDVPAIFRTAMHAQSLYMVRDQLQAVKAEHFNLGDETALLFIRDEAQGFYAGTNEYDESQHSIMRTSPFSRAIFDQILEFALQRASDEWGAQNVPRSVTMVYKFHLIDGVFQAWAPHWKSKFGVDVDFVQPDTMNRNLMAFGVQGRRIVIAGNEYADIIQPVFLRWFSNSTPETMYAENIYLHPSLRGLSEYQTVHGSADGIAGQGLVNPFATIRAAAVMLEHHAGDSFKGVQGLTEKAIQNLLERKITTPDQQGSSSTEEVAAAFLQEIETITQKGTLEPPPAGPLLHFPLSHPWMGKNSALVVVDYQNDFISGKPSPAMAELADTIPKLIKFVREQGKEVIFVRFLGNTAYYSDSWQHRNEILGKAEKCVEGTWGAALGGGVSPGPGEQVFDKKTLFDPFLVPEFTEYLAKQKLEHLILAGLYTDVCVDATARTAFQKGLLVTVLENCTVPLHSSQHQHLEYMEKVYGARVVQLDHLIKMQS